jgi:BASS family bile acid:Na+ symporter
VVLTAAFDFYPAVEIALVALAISPIPPLLPRRHVAAGGRASYALGLLTAAALLSVAVVPSGVVLVGWLFGEPFGMAPEAVAGVVLLTVLLPLAAGMGFAAGAPAIAARIVTPVTVVAMALLGAAALAILGASLSAIASLIGNGTVLAIAGFVAVGRAVGHALGGPEPDERVVLALSTACRHPAIALAVATANYPHERLVIAAILLYLVLGIAVSIPYVIWQRRAVARTGVPS